MDSKKLFYISLATCAVCFSVVAIEAASKASNISIFKSSSGTGGHVLRLDSSKTPNSITASYQNNVSGTVTTSNGNSVTLNFVNAKKIGSEFVTLANHGKIYTFGENQKHQITAVNGISFTGSGSLLFKPCSYKNVLAEVDPIVVNAGSASVSIPSCDTFEIEAGDSGATINELVFNYSCDPSAYDIALLAGTYTGYDPYNFVYKLTINEDGASTLVSLDKANAVSLSGTTSLSSKTNATFSGSGVTYNMIFDGYKLTGTASGSLPAIEFNRVYSLDDFESYTGSGQGYTSDTTKYQTTNLRSGYYAEYKSGSSSSPIGGSGWLVMTSTDNTTYTSNKGHNSSKASVFKFSNGTMMRYISMSELYGVDHVVGRGTTFSFWSRGAFTNTNLDTDHSSDISMDIYAFYESPLNSTNVETAGTIETVKILHGSSWQHFEISIDSSRDCYGFGICTKQSNGSTMYVPFDDFEIYTASPYATYVNYPEGTYKGVAKVNGNDFDIVLAIGNSTNKLAAVRLSNVDAVVTSSSYNTSTKKITINTSGSYSSLTFGTITGTFDHDTRSITGISCAGSIKNYVSNNGSIVAYEAKNSSTEFFDNCDGTTAQLQARFKRRYKPSGWEVDNTNADRLTCNTTEFVGGTNSVKRRGYSSAPVSLNYNNDFASPVTVKNIQFWVYNPSNSDITLRLWGYDGPNLATEYGHEPGSVTAKANQWTYLAMGFNSQLAIYNFQIADFNNTGAYLSFDNIYIFS